MKRISREVLTDRLHQKVREKKPIILAGAGCGIAAKAEESAGADMIMAYNTGIYRMDGHVSLMGYRYYSDGNGDTLRLAGELAGAVKETPVMAGVCAEDPTRDMDDLLRRLMEAGYSGITNVPSVAGAAKKPGSVFGASVKAYGLGADAERELVCKCDKENIFTAMYAYDTEEIKRFVSAGADLLSVHVGGTAGGSTGSLGEELLSLEAAAEMTDRCYEIAMQENPNVLMVTHGGPFESPGAVEYCFSHARCHGYIGASGVERIPVEKELRKVYRSYRSLHL